MQGLVTALVTPFLADGTIDIESFTKLVHFQIENKVDGLLIGGTTGESPTLSEEEWEILIRIGVKEAKGRIPVFAGIGTYSTYKTVENTRKALMLGVDAGVAIFPYYNKPVFEGCVAHFAEVGRVGLPTIIYYHPGRTGLSFSTEQLAKICALPGIIGMKDCSGNPSFASEVKKLSGKLLYSGDDPLAIASIQEGADGLMSVSSNAFPSEWSQILQYCFTKNFKQARSLYEKMKSFSEAIFLETSPQGIKYAMSLFGLCNPFMRLPLIQPNLSTQKKIKDAIEGIKALSMVSG